MNDLCTNRENDLTGTRLLLRNTIWNLLGGAAPILVAVFCIPSLVEHFGTDRFGILTLAWALVGYFSVFDFGLGRALTKYAVGQIGIQAQNATSGLFWTALLLMTILGLFGAGALAAICPGLVHKSLRIPQGLQTETLRAFFLLALSVPLVTCTAGLRGFLEAQQRFELVNAVRIPLGVFTFAGPLLVMPFSHSLVSIAAVLVTGRLIAFGFSLLLCLRVSPELRRVVVVQRAFVGPLIRFGGWLTVSNIVSPLMVYMDRFLIGMSVSIAAVTYYVTPYEAVTKLLFIPAAVAGVLFPAFSATYMEGQNRIEELLGQGIKYTFLVLYPVILVTVTLAHESLTLWLGKDFARIGTPVLQWLSVGILFNALAQIPFAQLQAVGRPDLTAKLHLVELPCYLLVLCWLVEARGIVGAAIAWTARTGVDMAALLFFSRTACPGCASIVRRILVMTASSAFVLAGGASLPALPYKLVFLFLAMIGFTLSTWFFLLAPDEKGIVHSWLKPPDISPYAE